MYNPHGNHKENVHRIYTKGNQNVLLQKINTKEGREEMKEKKLRDRQKTNSKKAETSYPLSVITLNVNGLNSLIKRHRLAKWICSIVIYNKKYIFGLCPILAQSS